MCGIVGYVGGRPCLELLLDGLERLEHRGYDSAGVALLGAGAAVRVRAVGPIAALRSAIGEHPDGEALRVSTTGIGHTRWATHGRVREGNAHPLTDDGQRVQIVLNGIVENHAELRALLQTEGARFDSDTDAEVVAHLVARSLERGGLADAVRETTRMLQGHFAFVAATVGEPGLVATRRVCPLVVGQSGGERFVGSALAGMPEDVVEAIALGDDEIVVLDAASARVLDANGRTVMPRRLALDGAHARVSRGTHVSYMRAEIEEQPQALRRTLSARPLGPGLDELPWPALRDARRIAIVACGTSYHAGLAGRFMLERWAGLRVDVDIASEWRYRDPDVGLGDLVLGITQSGETADTIGALRMARGRGARVLALTNVPGSQVTREAEAVLATEAGSEIGVAATKTFVTQVAALAALARTLGEVRGVLDDEQAARIDDELQRLPAAVDAARADTERAIGRAAERWGHEPFFLFLGRHAGLAVALEGALKLKEIAYIPSDAYAAGEMKHGPIALLSDGTPVVVVATESPVLDKLRSNVAEVRARGAHVIAVASEGAAGAIADEADELLLVPRTDPLLAPIPAVVPLQLLAHEIALARGLDPDRPRNLAKTVTVE